MDSPSFLAAPARLAALRRAALLDSPLEESFDRLTRLATRLLGVPVALVSLVDQKRQFFKSQCGLPEPWASQRETPLSHSFCQYVVESGEALVVEDAREHPLLRENPAIHDMGVVAYAGIPLRMSEGHVLGSLSAIDRRPRAWTTEELALLRDLAASVVAEIELRLAAQQRQELEQHTLREHQERTHLMAERLRAVASFASSVIGARSMEALDAVLRVACARVLPHDVFTFGIYIEAQHALHFVPGWDQEIYDPPVTIPLAGRPSERVVRERRSMVTRRSGEDAAHGAVIFGTGRPSESVIRTPILSGERVRGVISVQSYTPELYTEEHVEVLEAIAAVAASAIENIELQMEADAAHTALRESEQRLRSLFENTPVGLYRSTQERLIDVNPALVRILGYPDREAVLAAPLDGFAADPEEHIRWNRVLLRDGQIRDVESRGRRRDGTIIWIRESTRAVRNEQGRVLFYDGVIEDITERKQLEEQLRQAQKMEAVGQLAGGIAHDFNNLLTAIQGHTHMLLDDAPSAEARDDLEAISGAVERAGLLTRQLLAFSRKQVVQPQVINLNLVVENMQRILRRTISENIDLETHLDPALTRVRADGSQLEQVVMNLVVNARDAMPRGGRLVLKTDNVLLEGPLSSAFGTLPAGRYARLQVEDTGCGMTAEVQQRIFEPFFTTKSKGEGTGLGLSTVYGIVQQSGAGVVVESRPGEGTQFTLLFPAVEGEAAPEQARFPRIAAPGGTETVLLVEDDPAVRGLVRSVLRSKGYQVLEASDGPDALRVRDAFQGDIDLLLSDVVMPRMSGRELAERLTVRDPSLPVLFMSGYTDDAVLLHGIEKGQPFLRKPFAPDELLVSVRRTLDQQWPRPRADDAGGAS